MSWRLLSMRPSSVGCNLGLPGIATANHPTHDRPEGHVIGHLGEGRKRLDTRKKAARDAEVEGGDGEAGERPARDAADTCAPPL